MTTPNEAVKERPILMSAPMVKALLANTKTQTRRVVKPQPRLGLNGDGQVIAPDYFVWDCPSRKPFCLPIVPALMSEFLVDCPYGKPGDRLYVKEAAWMWCERRTNGKTKTGRPKWHYVPLRAVPIFYVSDEYKPATSIVHPETGNQWVWRHKVARFMPRWASRITLEITEVRVQRLQEISFEDCRAEGCDPAFEEFAHDCTCGEAHRGEKWAYLRLWQSINGPGSWAVNPWVWAISFKRVGDPSRAPHATICLR